MAFVAGQPVPFTLVPDWSQPVRETLAWRTEVLRAPTSAISYHRSLRMTPARSFEALFTNDGARRRLAEQLIRAKAGREFLLPIWPDVQQLAALSAGAAAIACQPAGRDFVDGGQALLLSDINAWEVVQIDSVEANSIALDGVLASSWPAGVRLYPLRRARLRNGAEEMALTDLLGSGTLSFDVREPCDWAAVAPTSSYLGRPVLELRPNDGELREATTHERLLASVDNGLGDAEICDLAGTALGALQLAWGLFGRQERAAFRSLLYALRGAATPVWLPSWRQDLRVLAPIAAAAVTISVEWSGYVPLGARVPNRRDIRIELVNGTKFYRRITGAVEAGAAETLTINAALGQDVDPSAIRAVSFMTLAVASDTAVLEHLTDVEGVARTSLGFSSVVPDV